MKSKWVFFVCLVMVWALLWGGLPGEAEAGSSASLTEALESAKALDLNQIYVVSAREGVEIPPEDSKFMDLLRAKLRLAHFLRLRELGYNETPISQTYDASTFFDALAYSGSVNMAERPFDLGDYVVFQIILPLELETLIRELPIYYDAIISQEGWQQKFNLMLQSDAYGPPLEEGRLFLIAGFPRVNEDPVYSKALSVEGAINLYEFDSSIEGWLYSFWLRRYRDGSMETVKKILDWLNRQLDEAAQAVG
ncbi:MAG TPA: hypothetical protein PK364_04140 [Synergistaceae bacterium]|nr:hypothetical protein [Synergistaceae bacterium]HPJ25592.1 hypothetical protein [Synergistaceae bacterium]HPQ37721.1 hypothetical protein [Synergistaceae bacterium]